MKNNNDIVALNDSQILRWICELNGIQSIKSKIKFIKKQTKNKENKDVIEELYNKLYVLQYQKDYFCMIMNSEKDYDRANQGFQINGYRYHRLLGTNGGIKNPLLHISEIIFFLKL